MLGLLHCLRLHLVLKRILQVVWSVELRGGMVHLAHLIDVVHVIDLLHLLHLVHLVELLQVIELIQLLKRRIVVHASLHGSSCCCRGSHMLLVATS